MRETLLAFVRAVQADYPAAGVHNLSRHISLGGGAEVKTLRLTFGRGYFDGTKVLVRLDDQVQGQAETEEAVNAYCDGRVPQFSVGS